MILKVLAALRCLGKSVGVEDVEDAAHISAQCLQVFVPRFIRWMAEMVYPTVVKLPEGGHLQESLHVYARLGFPGAYCDTDGVHLSWSACPAKHTAIYTGKEGYPTVGLAFKKHRHMRGGVPVHDSCVVPPVPTITAQSVFRSEAQQCLH